MDNAFFYPICDIIPDNEGHGIIIGNNFDIMNNDEMQGYMYITEKGFIVSYDSDASEIYWNQQYKSYYYLALE